MQIDDVAAVSGLMLSNWGCKAWRLLFGQKEIVAWPYKSGESFRLAVFIELGFVNDPGSVLVTNDRDNFQKALVSRELRTYLVKDITCIKLRSCMTRHKIEIYASKGVADVYGMWDRHHIENYRELFRRLYPHCHSEEGFPTTFLGKMMRW
jgi:hypothetical protein